MPNDKKPAPTEDEVRAAHELLMRHAAAQAEAEREAVAPIVDLAASEEFTKVHDAVFAIDSAFLAHEQIGPQLMAARAGLSGLASVAARFGPPPEPAV